MPVAQLQAWKQAQVLAKMLVQKLSLLQVLKSIQLLKQMSVLESDQFLIQAGVLTSFHFLTLVLILGASQPVAS